MHDLLHRASAALTSRHGRAPATARLNAGSTVSGAMPIASAIQDRSATMPPTTGIAWPSGDGKAPPCGP